MDVIWQALSLDALPYLIAAVIAAGIVRGFSGFGTAMVYMPIAAIFLEPIHAMLTMMTFDLFGPIALMPRAWRDGEPKDVGVLGLGALVALPIGVYFLTRMDPIVFRWIVSILSLVLLILLASGWRYRNPLRTAGTLCVGLVSGFLSGIAALPGPPVILSYMSSPRPVSVIRGNTMMYLFLVDILAFIVFALKGLLVFVPLVIGAILTVPYGIAGLIGQRIFNPAHEVVYRTIAYAMIAFSAIAGMPIWG